MVLSKLVTVSEFFNLVFPPVKCQEADGTFLRINPGSFKIKCWALCFGSWQALFSLPLDLTSHHRPSPVCPVCAVDSKYVCLPSAHCTVCRFGASDTPWRLSSLLLLHAWFGVCWFHIRLQNWGVALGWPVREHCPLATAVG